MIYAYYHRLTGAQKRAYRRSDEITTIRLPQGEALRAMTGELARALSKEDRGLTERLSQRLTSGITERLRAPTVRVEVLQVRPSNHPGELHGLYTPGQRNRPAHVRLWMRTAKRHQVVAFRTFLRTLLHELCHHLDYEWFRLQDSFHTEGFYKRESSLVYQLLEKDPDQHPPADQKVESESRS